MSTLYQAVLSKTNVVDIVDMTNLRNPSTINISVVGTATIKCFYQQDDEWIEFHSTSVSSSVGCPIADTIKVQQTSGSSTTCSFSIDQANQGESAVRSITHPLTGGSVISVAGKNVLNRRNPNDAVVNIAGLERWHLALTNAERVPAYLLATGNSTLDGVSTDGTTTPNDVEMDKFSYIGQLRTRFARYYGANEAGSIPAKDSRTVMSGTTSALTNNNTVTGPGGNNFRVMPTGSVATVAVPKSSRVIIDYYGGTGYGAFTYSIDGGDPVAVDAQSPTAGSYRQIVLSGLTEDAHTVVITSTANSAYYGGVRYDSGRGTVVSKYARSSWGMYDWFGVGNNSSGASAAGQLRAKLGAAMGSPNLFVLSFIRNDMKGRVAKPLNISGYPSATGFDIAADYELLYGYVTAAGGCMLIIDEPADKFYPALEGNTYENKPAMDDIEKFHADFAATHPHCAYVSLPKLFGYWEEANGRGFYRNAGDQIHYGPRGLGATAEALWEILRPRSVFANDY